MDNDEVGGKCSNLIQLMQLGMNVPNTMVLTTSAYENQAIRCGLHEKIFPLIEEQDWAGVEQTAFEILTHCPLDENLSSMLLDQYSQMQSPVVAVRSSATCEDQEGTSSAGQYETYLNIQGTEALLQAVRNCWASLWSRRALVYRQRQATDRFSARMAVIIQEMIPADAAGVLFTQDPLLSGDNHMRIEIVPGLGEALVSGDIAGDVYRIDRTSLAETRENGRSELLSPNLLKKLCGMALRIEEHFGCPQDIEFALAQDTIHLLQARPMTALMNTTVDPIEPLGKPSFLDKMIKPFVDERYVIAPRPLDNVVVKRLLGGHLYSIKEGGAVIKQEDEEKVMAQLWRQAYRMPPIHRLWLMYFRGVSLLFRQLKTDWLSWWEDAPSGELQTVSKSIDLSSMADEELFRRAETILAVWEKHLYKRMSAAGGVHAESLLRLLVALAVGPTKRDEVMSNLMAGIETPTITLNEDLWQLSRLARQHPEVLASLRDEAPHRLKETAVGRDFMKAFNFFIDRHGHREGPCWYLTTPTWRHDQIQVWRLLASLVVAEKRTGNPEFARVRHQEALLLVEKRLRYILGLRSAFRWLWHHLYRLNAFREKSHYDLTRPIDALQEISYEWERRFIDRGILEREGDIGYLTYEEIREWLCDRAPARETVRELLARRRATYRLVNARWQAERSGVAAQGEILKGIAASPGIIQANVRIIRGEHEFGKLMAGEVLVCPYTNPAWTPLFATAAAVVTETGGLASHAAIVAREYGIPAVMGIPGVTRNLKNGQKIEVDGNRGVVFK
nr:PEP/pyruvate-binding domain-containing protein [Desulfobulbus rhabdoformis]